MLLLLLFFFFVTKPLACHGHGKSLSVSVLNATLHVPHRLREVAREAS